MAQKITPRDKDYSQWYIDVVTQAQLADYAPVKGCMVIRPNGYAIWEKIQQVLDGMFKETGHVNAYFPLFIPESFIHKEAEHVEGFAPELAIVTHGGGKELEEKLVVRPTSETIIWSMYAKWIQSYRDLPILINQWANIVRWEMRTRLFLRTTEFLWQEGHTAHATEQEAEEETLKMLGVYKKFAEEYMAIPVIDGKKTDSEKFAGALKTYCIEAMMQDKKALQAGTSHNLGENFAKAFDVTFQDKDGQRKYVWATSWGVSTRLVGALVMAHSDDKGLVLPPRLASTHVVIVPIWNDEDEKAKVLDVVDKLKARLGFVSVTAKESIGIKVDDREQYKPGWKFNEWELLGVPIRIEIGPKDVENSSVVIARRDTGTKQTLPAQATEDEVSDLLIEIQKSLFDKAKEFREKNTFNIDDYNSLKKIMDNEEGFVNAHWCGSGECEAKVKEETKATIRCIPFEKDKESGKCVVCKRDSEGRVIFAKAY
jgi:prolyl-tRNA synthetase